jgi:hypothetical protein
MLTLLSFFSAEVRSKTRNYRLLLKVKSARVRYIHAHDDRAQCDTFPRPRLDVSQPVANAADPSYLIITNPNHHHPRSSIPMSNDVYTQRFADHSR